MTCPIFIYRQSTTVGPVQSLRRYTHPESNESTVENHRRNTIKNRRISTLGALVDYNNTGSYLRWVFQYLCCIKKQQKQYRNGRKPWMGRGRGCRGVLGRPQTEKTIIFIASINGT